MLHEPGHAAAYGLGLIRPALRPAYENGMQPSSIAVTLFDVDQALADYDGAL
jgi:hypothetical protein